MQNKGDADLWLSRIGSGLIICYCFLASIFFSIFAKIHLTFGSFPLPIFIGEILLFICLLLFTCLCKNGFPFSRRTGILLGLYFGWVLIKAGINFYYDGPLTGRNAALFYYPVFAIFSYCFFQKGKVTWDTLKYLIILAAGVLLLQAMVFYYWWTYVLLFVIALWNTKSPRWRWIGWIFLTGVLLIRPEILYEGSRSHFVAISGSVLFLTFYFGAIFSKHKQFVPIGLSVLAFIIFILGAFIFSKDKTLSELASVKEVPFEYQAINNVYKSEQKSYVPEALPVQLYRPVKPQTQTLPEDQSIGSKVPGASSNPGMVKEIRLISGGIFYRGIDDNHPLKTDVNNIIFRFMVWRDMARELVQERKWWGFSFGHPQRSRTLEVMNWATSEWSRDGWITPHNSFFHVIYRAGILGIGLILYFFFILGKLVHDFFKMNSVEGGLLVAILIYWIVLSNFLVILEFPYNAILFWSLLGISMAFRDGLKAKDIKPCNT